MEHSTKENKTLFLRNIPYTISKEQLEDKFSDFGPIKQCFLVNDKGTGKSRGFGYVKFTVLDDAKKAKEGKIVLDGRKVNIDYADIKKKKKPRKRNREMADDENKGEDDGKTAMHDEDDESEDEDMKVVVKQEPEEVQEKGQNVKYHKAKIVRLSGLPTDVTEDELDKLMQKMGVKQMAERKLMSGTGAQLKFKCIRDAKRAIRKLHNHAYKDCMIQAAQLSQEKSLVPQHNTTRMARVIVRNLSFKCREAELEKAFKHCGEITEVKVPSKPDGKMLGFGFVQFASLEEAKRAVEEMNTHKILGRPVAVDWALPKGKYESTLKTEDAGNESDEGSFSAESDISSDETKQTTNSKYSRRKSESSGNEGVSSDEEKEDKKRIDRAKMADSDESDDDSDGNDDEEDDDDDDDSSDDDGGDGNVKEKKAKNKAPQQSDTDDGCTLFIRNLSFDSTEDGMLEYFEQYGELKYAKVVVNPNTEHSKGMGFVRFKTKESAEKCLQESEAGNVSLDGRQLNITLAVSREKAAGFQQKETKEKKDNRNLYLAREGMIRPGTQAAEGLSKQDLEKRMKVEEVKRQKLKNLDIFISPLRMCVRNIPATVDDAQLRKIFKDAAGDPQAKVNECRIMRDRARTNAEGIGKSSGFGFISFGEHQHALTALRHCNNNPDIFGDKKRLIVEFSLENRKALETQERRKERMQAKLQLQKTMKEDVTGARKKPGMRNTPVTPTGSHQRGGVKHANKSSNLPLLKLSEKDKELKSKNMPKGMPSHWGPKIRHNPRPSQMQGKKKGKAQDSKHPNNRQQQQQQQQQGKRPANWQNEGPSPKKQRKGKKQDFDDFDVMVNKYKNKLFAKKSDKWFE